MSLIRLLDHTTLANRKPLSPVTLLATTGGNRVQETDGDEVPCCMKVPAQRKVQTAACGPLPKCSLCIARHHLIIITLQLKRPAFRIKCTSIIILRDCDFSCISAPYSPVRGVFAVTGQLFHQL